MKTVLFVGAGRHQRRPIEHARARLRVVAVDRTERAPGLASADAAEVVEFTDVGAVVEVGHRHGVDGVLTVSADRAVPVAAAVAEELGLPGIGRATAHLMTHELEMRDMLAAAGVPQPRYARLRSESDVERALEAVGLPAVLKPVDSGGQRAVFRIESADDLRGNATEAISESPTGEAIVEAFVDGLELNGIAIARGGDVALGAEVGDDLALPQFSQPLAIRFFTAEPGPPPTGRVVSVGSLEPVLAAEGVVQADTYLDLGETIRPVRRDGDRRGYVIAIADDTDEARRRTDDAASLLLVEVEAGLAA